MKLAFVFALLASLAVLSLAAPTLNGDEAMLEALAATLSAETHDTASADSTVADLETVVQTKETTKTSLGGNYDEHIQPVLGHLADLRAKLSATVKASAADIEIKTATATKAQKTAEEVPLHCLPLCHIISPTLIAGHWRSQRCQGSRCPGCWQSQQRNRTVR